MNKVELLNYIHWFSLKTQFKNTSGSVQLRLHNKPLPGWGGGRIRSSLRTVISHTRLLVAPNAAPHLLASSRLWYQRAPKRWIKVMWVTFAGRAFHFITNIEVWILFNQPSWNIHIQWGPPQPQWHSWDLIIGSEYLHCDWVSLLSFECDCQITGERAEQEGSSSVSIATHQSGKLSQIPAILLKLSGHNVLHI